MTLRTDYTKVYVYPVYFYSNLNRKFPMYGVFLLKFQVLDSIVQDTSLQFTVIVVYGGSGGSSSLYFVL